MLDKNIVKDILPYKTTLIFIIFFNIIQATMIVSISYIIAYLADKLLFDELVIVQQLRFWCCCFSFYRKSCFKLYQSFKDGRYIA